MADDLKQQQYHTVTLPDSSEVDFPIEMKDEDVAAAVKKIMDQKAPPLNGPLPEQPNNPPSSAVGRWLRRTASGIADVGTRPGRKLNEAVGNFSKGDVPAGLLGLVNSAAAVPGAALSVLNYAPVVGPAINQGLSSLAQPGVNAWNALQPNIRPATKATFKAVGMEAPTLFSSEANKEANELGQGASGAASATALTALAGPAAEGTRTGVNAARQGAADALSQAALKIPPTIKGTKAAEILETSQKYNATPTQAGLARLDAATENLTTIQKQMEDMARTGDNPTVPVQAVLKSLDDVIERWGKSDTPDTFTNIIRKYRDQVASQQNPRFSLDDMIAIKRNLQMQLEPVYRKAMRIDPGVRQTIIDEAKSAVEHDLRLRLEETIPGYKDVNSEIHKLIDTRDFVDRATNRISNYHLLQLRDLAALNVGGGMGYMLHGDVGAWVGSLAAELAQRVMTNPRNWSRVANILSTKAAPTFEAKPAATATQTSPYSVSISNRALPPAGVGQTGEEGWQQHPGGFRFRELPEGK